MAPALQKLSGTFRLKVNLSEEREYFRLALRTTVPCVLEMDINFGLKLPIGLTDILDELRFQRSEYSCLETQLGSVHVKRFVDFVLIKGSTDLRLSSVKTNSFTRMVNILSQEKVLSECSSLNMDEGIDVIAPGSARLGPARLHCDRVDSPPLGPVGPIGARRTTPRSVLD